MQSHSIAFMILTHLLCVCSSLFITRPFLFIDCPDLLITKCTPKFQYPFHLLFYFYSRCVLCLVRFFSSSCISLLSFFQKHDIKFRFTVVSITLILIASSQQFVVSRLSSSAITLPPAISSITSHCPSYLVNSCNSCLH